MKKHLIFFAILVFASCKSNEVEDKRIELLRDTGHEGRMKMLNEIIESQKRTGEKLDSLLEWQRRFLDSLKKN